VEMSKALAQDGLQAQLAALQTARAKFEVAGKDIAALVADLKAQLAKMPEPTTPAEKTARTKLEQTKLRAELAAAVNLIDIARATVPEDHPDNAELSKRAKLIGLAIEPLQKVAANDESFSETWQAKAWLALCEFENGNPPKARERLVPIISSTN